MRDQKPYHILRSEPRENGALIGIHFHLKNNSFTHSHINGRRHAAFSRGSTYRYFQLSCLAYIATLAIPTSGIAFAQTEIQQPQCDKVIIHIHDQRFFSPLTNTHPGCRQKLETVKCLDTGIIERISVQNDSSSSYSRIVSTQIDPTNPRCARFIYEIAVDHSGPEGKLCLQAVGSISFDAVLVPSCSKESEVKR